MLQLSNIRKNYQEGDHVVHALRGINLGFRDHGFVSILGPSGCGKTTLLNIIGGLDQYTEGDMRIRGRSTKDFGDRDWDGYRNHSIGFVFQSYHLIPHQSVLQNVELALTLSGVEKQERRKRAASALERVGLGDQLHKRPGQMSGGQQQRVAIARAIVNDPDIILADEPTGALDSETSLQVMEILKEISREKLVIMVTHNPELAQKYSTRIIRMWDGQIVEDSAPVTGEDKDAERKVHKVKTVKQLPQMSFKTAFGLSLKNLFIKKGRTALTAFAGSIGVIGIALIFAVSQGTRDYIDAIQEDTLTAYPLTLEASTVDMGVLIQTFMTPEDTSQSHPLDAVYARDTMAEMINALNNIQTTENDLQSFREYLLQELDKDPQGQLRNAITGITYAYDLDLQVYTKAVDGQIIISDPQTLLNEAITKNLGMNMSGMLQLQETVTSSFGGADILSGGMKLWTQLLPGMDGEVVSPVLHNQYELVSGRWPEQYDEIVLVVSEEQELNDLTLYALGIKSEEEIDAIFSAVLTGQQIQKQQDRWDYRELLDREFRVVLSSDCYVQAETGSPYTDLRLSDAGLSYLYDHGIDLRITGIIRPRADAKAKMISGSIGYTRALTEYVIAKGHDTQAVREQLQSPDRDIFTGLPFRDTAGELEPGQKQEAFIDRVRQMDPAQKSQIYIGIKSIPSQEQMNRMTDEALERVNREQMQQSLIVSMEKQIRMNRSQLQSYVQGMTDPELLELYTRLIQQQIYMQLSVQAQQQLAPLGEAALAEMLDRELSAYSTEQCALYYDHVLEFSDSTLEENLLKLGYVDPEKPAAIQIYASSFENKDLIETVIAGYNENVEELKQIRYTDYVGIIMASVTTIIRAITYVLIGFVAISLIVSSIMIGVITLISVQERTKEIGILRAIGASKTNVSGMFNAETVIIGFASGLLGVVVTWLVCIPMNSLVEVITGLDNLRAKLPWQVALILICVSVGLTLLSGLIPSRSAARKDPVVALRTE